MVGGKLPTEFFDMQGQAIDCQSSRDEESLTEGMSSSMYRYGRQAVLVS